MLIPLVEVKAKNIEPGCFVFLKDEKLFFWVDDVSVEDDSVTLIFEISVMNSKEVSFSHNTKLKVFIPNTEKP